MIDKRWIWTMIACGALATLAPTTAQAEQGAGKWYRLEGKGHKGAGFRSMYVWVPTSGWKTGQTVPDIMPKQYKTRPCPMELQPAPAQYDKPSYWAPSPFGERTWVYVPNFKQQSWKTPPAHPTALPPNPPTGKGSYCKKEDASKTASGAPAPKAPPKKKKKKKKKKTK